eukprot:COSAG01_NODE_46032_length_403_cov_25.753289_1_plen_125_part_01
MLEMILDHSTNILCVAQVQRRVDLASHTAQVWRSHTCRLWHTSSRIYIGAGLNRSRDNTRDSANRDLVVYRPLRIAPSNTRLCILTFVLRSAQLNFLSKHYPRPHTHRDHPVPACKQPVSPLLMT